MKRYVVFIRSRIVNPRILNMFLCLVIASVSTADDIDLQIELQLAKSGDNRAEIATALADVPDEQRESMRFLVAWMTGEDLKQLTSERLLENVALATETRSLAPWQQQIPDDVFNNFVLPHACFDEPRDPWRADFYHRFWPWVKDCRTTSEAAQVLNQKVFAELKVKYSTGRRRANQSPAESIEQGLASCSGLAVILVDACRSVGVPARIAGIPKWANKEGNHTWVEVWDHGWHFAGAAEYDAQGLDHAWFTNDAALADPPHRAEQIGRVAVEERLAHIEEAGDHAQCRSELVADAGIDLPRNVGGKRLAAVGRVVGRYARGFKAARVAGVDDQ